MTLADRLEIARKSMLYTQKEMAKAASVSVQMWQAYESGKSVPGGNVLEALARMGFNVNWLLTGNGPRGLSDEDSSQLQFKEAYESLRESIARQREPRSLDKFFPNVPEEGRLTPEQFDAYLNNEYAPTKEQLIVLCEMAGSPFSDNDFKKIVTQKKYKHIQKAAIDEHLLKLAIEVIEDIEKEGKPFDSKQKAELVNLIYVMNQDTAYNKERLKRFIEAVCIFLEQGVDFNQLSERKLSNIIIEIAHHVVKVGEDENK